MSTNAVRTCVSVSTLAVERRDLRRLLVDHRLELGTLLLGGGLQIGDALLIGCDLRHERRILLRELVCTRTGAGEPRLHGVELGNELADARDDDLAIFVGLHLRADIMFSASSRPCGQRARLGELGVDLRHELRGRHHFVEELLRRRERIHAHRVNVRERGELFFRFVVAGRECNGGERQRGELSVRISRYHLHRSM